ncbi:hypothetical protein D3C78_1135950 [compost metagenome]
MAAQCRAGLGFAVDNVQHARRQAQGIGDLAVGLLDQRGDFRGLEHHGAACRQGRGELPGAGHQREVPRHDQADHTHRLQPGAGGEARCGQRHFAIPFRQLLGQVGVISEGGYGIVQVDFGLMARLAVVAHLQADQCFTALPKLLGKTAQVRRTLVGADLLPDGQGVARRRHGLVDLGNAGGHQFGKRLAQCRVIDADAVAALAFDPAAGDVVGSGHGRYPVRPFRQVSAPACARCFCNAPSAGRWGHTRQQVQGTG